MGCGLWAVGCGLWAVGCGLRAGGAPAHGVEPGPGSGFRTGDIAISGPRKSDIAISGRYTISVCICVYIYIYMCFFVDCSALVYSKGP